MSCPCNLRLHPAGRVIPPGLPTFARQIAGFPEFREAMLADLGGRPALAGWRARAEGDLGLMLIEMWAVVADALAFQDDVIAHECYLRTARRRPSVRRLVDLLGYVPRPAVAATVRLAVLAEGRLAIKLPAGTPFRSAAFGDEAPQVFELDRESAVHPLTNRWPIQPPRALTIGQAGAPGGYPATLTLDPRTARLAEGDLAVVSSASGAFASQIVTVGAVASIVGADGGTYVSIAVSPALTLPPSTALADVRIAKTTQTASVWTLTANEAASSSGASVLVSLDGIHRQLKAGQRVIYELAGALHTAVIDSVAEVSKTVETGTVNDLPTTAEIPVTRISFDAGDAGDAAFLAAVIQATASTVVLHHQLVDAGRLAGQTRTSLAPPASGSLSLGGAVEAPSDGTSPAALQLRDKNLRGLELSGGVDFAGRKIDLGTGTTWTPDLALPVEAFGNVVSATRGESVRGEVLGSGDASVSHQSFKLKKSPLTYVTTPGAGSASGLTAQLTVHVGGIRWTEVPSFYGALPEDRVYVVRRNDAGESTLTFGDGIRGSRLPTGAGNVVAHYRFGAGEASPPAGSIQQLGKALKGVTGVVNPVAAGGGADAESVEDMQAHAPRGALLLGRAVSLLDMEAVAAGVAGVRAVRAEWRWSGDRQRPVVQIGFIGTASPAAVAAQVRSVADPCAAIVVEAAVPVPVDVALDIDVDTDRYLEADVVSAAAAALLDEGTGLLTPERLGIGAPFIRSRLSAAVLAVPGARGVSVQWNGATLTDLVVSPGAGRYFDVAAGSLVINGEEYGGGE